LLHGPQPVDEECRIKVATDLEKLGNVNFKLKDDDGTHLEHRSTTKTRHTTGLPLPPCPRVPPPQPDTLVPNQD